MRRNEKLELARVVAATERMLHRMKIRKLFRVVNPDSVPALTPQQCDMVMTVHERGCVTIRQLTEALCVKAPAASTMVDRLVEMGILTREENPRDRREVLVRVAPPRESEICELERLHLQSLVDLFEKIGMDHARTWGAVCARIQETLTAEQGR